MTRRRSNTRPPPAPVVIPAGAAPAADVPAHPSVLEVDGHLTATVNDYAEQLTPANTKKQYDKKILEYYEYCEHLLGTQDGRYHMTAMKLYRFMFYLSFREQKKRGGRWSNPQPVFDRSGYDALMARYYPPAVGQAPDISLLDITPKKPISKDTFNAYKAAMKKEYQRQVANQRNSLSWDHVWLVHHQELQKVVETRKA